MHTACLETARVSVSVATTRCCSQGCHYQMSLDVISKGGYPGCEYLWVGIPDGVGISQKRWITQRRYPTYPMMQMIYLPPSPPEPPEQNTTCENIPFLPQLSFRVLDCIAPRLLGLWKRVWMGCEYENYNIHSCFPIIASNGFSRSTQEAKDQRPKHKMNWNC